MSLEQKLAWARKNGVKPPEYVLAGARAKQVEQARAPACCSKCCSEKQQSKEPAAASKRVAKGVVLIAALGCQGADTNWMGIAVSVAPPAAVNWTAARGRIEQAAILSERICGISIPPSTPPPRVATVSA